MSFKADTRELKRFEKDLIKLNKRGVPFAVRSYLNDLAFTSRSEWQGEARKSMTLRSRFTENSIRVDKAKGYNMMSMKSVVGSTADYMETQEEGDTERKRGSHGVPIPAAPAGKRGPARKRTSKRKQLAMIKVQTSQNQGSARGIRLQALFRIAKGGGGYAFMKLRSGHAGIYHVRQGAKKLLVRKVWDLTKASVKIPENPMMRPAVARTQGRSNEFWKKALKFQLDRIQYPGRLR